MGSVLQSQNDCLRRPMAGIEVLRRPPHPFARPFGIPGDLLSADEAVGMGAGSSPKPKSHPPPACAGAGTEVQAAAARTHLSRPATSSRADRLRSRIHRLALPEPVPPAELPDGYPAPRRLADRPLPISCLLHVTLSAAHSTPPSCANTHALALACSRADQLSRNYQAVTSTAEGGFTGRIRCTCTRCWRMKRCEVMLGSPGWSICGRTGL